MIPVNEPLLDGNEQRCLQQCIETGWISYEGLFVERFEIGLAARVGRRYGIAVCNGAAALQVAAKSPGLGPGDEVILPTLIIISYSAAIVRARATPVVVESEPTTWNINVNKIEKNINERTKAIMVVHIYGLPVDMDPMMAIAEKYELSIYRRCGQNAR